MTGNSTLHLLNKAPEHPRYQTCINALSPSDTLVLIENGVLSAAGNRLHPPCKIYALKADIDARALEAACNNLNTIDYDELVQLTATHSKIISW
mgnify:CR=1 FL=1